MKTTIPQRPEKEKKKRKIKIRRNRNRSDSPNVPPSSMLTDLLKIFFFIFIIILSEK